MRRIFSAARPRSFRGRVGFADFLKSGTGLAWDDLWLGRKEPAKGDEQLVSGGGATEGHTPTGYFDSPISDALFRFPKNTSHWASGDTSFAQLVAPVIFAVIFRVLTINDAGILGIFGKRDEPTPGYELGYNIDGCIVWTVAGTGGTETLEARLDHQAAQLPQLVTVRAIPGGAIDMMTLLNGPLSGVTPAGPFASLAPFSIGANRLLAGDMEVGFMGRTVDPKVATISIEDVHWGIAQSLISARVIDTANLQLVDDSGTHVNGWT